MSTKYLDYAANILGLGKSKVVLYSFRYPFARDVRDVFEQTPEDDVILYNYYLKDLVLNKIGKEEYIRRVAKRVNQRIEYLSDSANFKKAEYWASPIETHNLMLDDCDGFAVLLCYLLRLGGFSPFEIFVRKGNVINDYGQIESHAHVIWYDLESNEWYPIEGSFYANRSLIYLGKVSLRNNPNYGDQATHFITNDVLSFSNYPIKLVR